MGDSESAYATRMSKQAKENSKDKVFNNRIFDTWVPGIMFLVDLILVVVVCVGMGVGRNADVEPWKMSVFSLDNYDILDTAIETYVTENNWKKSDTISSVSQRVVTLCDNVHLKRADNYPMYHCVYTATIDFKNDLDDVALIGDQNDLRQLVWNCSRSSPIPMEIVEITTLDLLLCALVWCTNAMITRTYTMYSLVARDDKMQVWTMLFATIFASLGALGVFGYGIYEVTSEHSDMSIIGVILLFFLVLGLVITAWMVIRHRSYTINDVDMKDAGTRFNASWAIVGLLKPLLVAPVYVMMVLGFCGITEFYTLLVCSILAIILALISSTLSYYNLYKTHRQKSLDEDHEFHMEKIGQKSRRPRNVILTAVVIMTAICFTSWPRRTDLTVLWDTEFGVFFLVFGLGAMIVPDIVYFGRYTSAMVLREQAEMLFRILIVMLLLSFVFV